jgi:hypothetical protein
VVRHAGHRARRNQQPAVMAASIVGENSMGMCAAWRAIPCLNKLHRIFDDLWPKGTARSRFLLCGLAAPVLHFALVEAHSAGTWAAGMTTARLLTNENEKRTLMASGVKRDGELS